MVAGHRRGALLLEVILALALFVMGGIALLTMIGRTFANVEFVRDSERAADLARSAMAKLEAGIATADTLDGPVRGWLDDDESFDGDELAEAAGLGGDGFADAPPPESAW